MHETNLCDNSEVLNSLTTPTKSSVSDGIDSFRQIVEAQYFPLAVDATDQEADFTGKIAQKEFGHLMVSELESCPAFYRRERQHLYKESQDSFLITMPVSGSVLFSQNDKETECAPSEFILEWSGAPYLFGYSSPSKMLVLKVPGDMLRDRVRNPEDFCAQRLSCTESGGALFMSFLNSALEQSNILSSDAALRFSEHLVDVLAGVVETSGIIASNCDSAVQHAHLKRIQNFISAHISDPELTPQGIADACGVSLRYLHLLFKQTEWTVSGWIRETRLRRCYNALLDDGNTTNSIADLAYRWGFADQAAFSRCFKNRFELTPGAVRAEREGLAKLPNLHSVF